MMHLNNRLSSNSAIWIYSIFFTLFLVIFQRYTGPTYPKKGKIVINGATISYNLLRSYNTDANAPVIINIQDTTLNGKLKYKRLNSSDDWTEIVLNKNGKILEAEIPKQAPAGKVLYSVTLYNNSNTYSLTDAPVVIRFKGKVPAWALIPHIIFIFLAMFISNTLLFKVILRKSNMNILVLFTFVSLVLGGAIFGPIVQKYAFGAYWTGWPFGNDLTDNKTLAAIIAWLVPFVITIRKKQCKWCILIAAVVLLLVYLIPHSLYGSELVYNKN